MRRTSAVVRAWDGPNSRISFEMDLDQMPWGPFEALGKRVTLLVPAPTDENGAAAEAPESQLERALRHVEHAAEKCAEFADLGNGNDHWRASLETWEWLRDFLTSAWMGAGAGREAREGAGDGGDGASAPDMPGAAATLEVAASALRQTPLAVWREAVGTFNPDAPTREEAIQTLLGVARVLARSGGPGAPATPEGPASRPSSGVPSPSPGAEEAGDAALPREEPPPDAGSATQAPDADPDEPSPGPAPEADGISFDYASGYDEGYRMGRRVGRALAARRRRDPDG